MRGILRTVQPLKTPAVCFRGSRSERTQACERSTTIAEGAQLRRALYKVLNISSDRFAVVAAALRTVGSALTPHHSSATCSSLSAVLVLASLTLSRSFCGANVSIKPWFFGGQVMGGQVMTDRRPLPLESLRNHPVAVLCKHLCLRAEQVMLSLITVTTDHYRPKADTYS